MQRAGLIGVGRMGSVMLRCLRRGGFEVVVYDASREATAPFAADSGVQVAASAREVAELADVVGIVVFDDAQVFDVLEGERGALAATGEPPVVLLHSTVTFPALRRVADAAAARGFPLLDAPVSGGTTEQQEAGDLCVMVGGDALALERARPVIDAFAGLVLHTGAVGSALDTKLLRNLSSYAMVGAMREVFALARSMGVPIRTITQVLDHTMVLSPNVRGSLAAGGEAPEMDPGAPPSPVALVNYIDDVMRKDLEAIRARARELGCALPIADVVSRAVERRTRKGD